ESPMKKKEKPWYCSRRLRFSWKHCATASCSGGSRISGFHGLSVGWMPFPAWPPANWICRDWPGLPRKPSCQADVVDPDVGDRGYVVLLQPSAAIFGDGRGGETGLKHRTSDFRPWKISQSKSSAMAANRKVPRLRPGT